MIIAQGFKQGEADSCLYSKHKEGHYTLILFQADDLILGHDRQMHYNSMVVCLGREVEIKVLVEDSYYLGISIESEGNDSFCGQSFKYAADRLNNLFRREITAKPGKCTF